MIRSSRLALWAAVLGAAGAFGAAPHFHAGAAWADAHEDGGHEDGGHAGGPGGGGNHDDGDHGGVPGGGHDDGGHDDGEHDDGDHGGGPGGEHGGGGPGGGGGGHEEPGGTATGATGEKAGTGDTPDRDGGELRSTGESDLGRLGLARLPERVLDRALAEALAALTEEVIPFYQLDLEGMKRALSDDGRNVRFIESPLLNLALLRDGLDGSSILSASGIRTRNETLLAAFLGTAADRDKRITPATVIAVTDSLGTELDARAASELAANADAIRRALQSAGR